ncbi:sulfatase [Streptomyces sp. NPDC048290]|uniref:sulfatase n=1 Tax=Streptomyces sp. NPDC048290 TaxID=3155811 RepID=UPI003414212B
MSLFARPRPRQEPDAEEGEDAGAATGDATEAGEDATEAAGDAAEGEAGTGTEADRAPSPRRRLHLRLSPRAARRVGLAVTVLAGLLLYGALLLPNRVERLSAGAFLRLPAEGILLAALLLALPARARRIAAVVSGAALGLVTVLKLVDMGFYQVLARPFDLVLDWELLDGATGYLKESFGRGGQVLVVTGALVLLVALLALTTLAMVRIARLMDAHRRRAGRTAVVLGTAWITCVTLGVQIAGVPVATKGNTEFLGNRVAQVRAGLRDAEVFERQAAVDAFADVPPGELLGGLRGKDVLFTFVESYGRTAIEHPDSAARIGAVLDGGTESLAAAGFGARSGWLRSPVTGAGSWLAHSTFLSGLWIKNQQRYRTLTTSDRSTLTRYFRDTGAWRTVGIVPGVRRAWPEGAYFGLDHVYDSERLGYHGPYFSWTPVPDQFALAAFERLEHGRRDRGPLMAEIILASSHNPWVPGTRMLDWDALGDGSVYEEMAAEGEDPEDVLADADRLRGAYRESVAYSLTSLVQWLERYGDDDTVLVFLGDHQPVPAVTDGRGGTDVPITVVARDEKVLDRIAGWGWTPGLKPAEDAPVWRMDAFRNRFLTAYGE